MPPKRPLLTASVERETRARWRAYAKSRGLPLSDLIEAMGQLLPDEDDKDPPWLRRCIALGSAIRDERGDRRPPPLNPD